jgi:hypothetical protein
MIKNKNNIAIAIIILSTISIVTTIILFVVRFKNNHQPLAIPEQTGAVNSPLPEAEKESYNQLYDLLDKDTIITDYFTINPIPNKRVIEVQVKQPPDVNRVKAEDWFKQNGYSQIPKDKIIYTEASY